MPNTQLWAPLCLQCPTFLSIVTAMFYGPLVDAVAVKVDQKNVIAADPAKHGTLQAACNPGTAPIHLDLGNKTGGPS